MVIICTIVNHHSGTKHFRMLRPRIFTSNPVCIGLNTVTSRIDIPFNLDSSVFTYTNTSYNPNTIYYIATLNVPKGRKMLYSMAEGWKLFANIQELDLTGLDSVQSDVQTVHKKWVRLDGKEVLTNLKRSGIYIHNGKKVLVK